MDGSHKAQLLDGLSRIENELARMELAVDRDESMPAHQHEGARVRLAELRLDVQLFAEWLNGQSWT